MSAAIKPWRERIEDPMTPLSIPMQAEITDLRAALAERDAEIERLSVDLAQSDSLLVNQMTVTEELLIECTTLRAAAQQGLDALKQVTRNVYDEDCATHLACTPAIATLTAALENKHE